MTGTPQATNQDAITILLKEYEQLIVEIRNIHDKRMALFKVLAGAFVALLGYVFAGFVLYVRSKGLQYEIPASIIVYFTLVGLILTLAVYLLTHNMYYYLGPSKKHTVRYWRSVHLVRLGLKQLVPETSKYLILPDGKEQPLRPNLSGRWEQGVLIYPLYHVVFYVIAALLISPLFALTQWNPSAGSLTKVLDGDSLELIKKSFILLLPIFLARLALGSGAMLRYYADILGARRISNNLVYPPTKLETKRPCAKFVGTALHLMAIVSATVLMAWMFLERNPIWFFYTGRLLIFLISTTLIGNFLYLYSYGFPLKLTWRRKLWPKISIKKDSRSNDEGI